MRRYFTAKLKIPSYRSYCFICCLCCILQQREREREKIRLFSGKRTKRKSYFFKKTIFVVTFSKICGTKFYSSISVNEVYPLGIAPVEFPSNEMIDFFLIVRFHKGIF